MSAEIAEWIYAARHAKDLTQAQLAKELGVGPAIIGFWENKRSEPSADRIVELERILGERTAWRRSKFDGKNSDQAFSSAAPEIETARNTEYQRSLLDLVPKGGESIGNGTLREQFRRLIGKNRKITDQDYWTLRNSLIDEGKLEPGRGRGGSVQAPLPRAESRLYEPFLEAIRSGYAPEHRISRPVMEITAAQGRRMTGGKWTRPDITLIAVRTFSFVPGKRLEVVTFEVKPDQDLAFDGVFEATAHSAFAHLAFLAVKVNGEKRAPDERILQECKRLGIGYITFTDADDYDTFEVVNIPSHREPDPYEVDKFITTQVSPAKQNELRELLR